jgi:aryl carrier-like protein
MKTLEPDLNDALHAKATTLLVELTAYNVMRLLHELQAKHAKIAFSGA